MSELLDHYYRLCRQNHWQIDSGQVAALTLLSETLSPPQSLVRQIVTRWFGKGSPCKKGVYLYGDVGRGKTMVMNLFYDHVDVFKKHRWHFVEFMALIHRRLKEAARMSTHQQPIDQVIDRLSNDADLICLDELQVNEIADAMLLSRLFSGLCESGVQIVFTSNLAPDELYAGGLHYERFRPFITFLQEQFIIHYLNNQENQDYRRQYSHPQQSYFNSQVEGSYEACERLMIELSGTSIFHRDVLSVNHRLIHLPKVAKKTIWMSFKDLCGAALGPSDYLALAQSYNLLFLVDVPQLTEDLKNEARRFITLIDTWYDQHGLLIMLIDGEFHQLFKLSDPSIPYVRIQSRLEEMQTVKYWSR